VFRELSIWQTERRNVNIILPKQKGQAGLLIPRNPFLRQDHYQKRNSAKKGNRSSNTKGGGHLPEEGGRRVRQKLELRSEVQNP